MMTKRLLFIIAILAPFFVACNKEKRGANKLSAGHGTWLIESAEVIQYDTLGNQTWDTIVTEPGELIFMSTEWGVANNLGSYVRFGASDSITVHSFNYYTDGNRATIADSGFEWIDGAYSIQKGGRRNQEWVALKYFTDPFMEGRIAEIRTMKIKKKRSL